MEKLLHTGPSDLPDQVWLNILSYLSADNLLVWTSLTVEEQAEFGLFSKLYNLCGDKALWRRVIWEGGNVKPIVLRKLVRFLGPYTQVIRIHGGLAKAKLLIPESLLHSIQTRCTSLSELHLINCSLQYHDAPLRKLPRSLERLVLNNIVWKNLPVVPTTHGSPFFRLSKRLPCLKWVGLSLSVVGRKKVLIEV